jgi:hypothetical protein
MYLAAAFQRQAEIHRYGALLEAAGHSVTSRWLASHEDTGAVPGGPPLDTPEFLAQQALEDIEDVQAADAVVSFTSPSMGRGGRHVEFGLAIALGKQLIVVGPREHVFHYLPAVRYLGSPAEFLRWADVPVVCETSIAPAGRDERLAAFLAQDCPKCGTPGTVRHLAAVGGCMTCQRDDPRPVHVFPTHQHLR